MVTYLEAIWKHDTHMSDTHHWGRSIIWGDRCGAAIAFIQQTTLIYNLDRENNAGTTFLYQRSKWEYTTPFIWQYLTIEMPCLMPCSWYFSKRTLKSVLLAINTFFDLWCEDKLSEKCTQKSYWVLTGRLTTCPFLIWECWIYFKPCRNMACSTFSYEPFFECLHTSNFI